MPKKIHFLIIFFNEENIKANHISGGNITAQCVGGLTGKNNGTDGADRKHNGAGGVLNA